jgi:sugar/nucleoside kinase (ribokinase family)
MATETPLNQDDTTSYLREHKAAKFVSAVDAAAADSDRFLLLSLDAFAGEPEVLYVALDYARRAGVEVRLIPQSRDPDPGQEIDRLPALLS